MSDIAVICAHPDLKNSRANRMLIEEIEQNPKIAVSRLYEKYPDFKIDIGEEQRILHQANTIILQFPLFWYSCPALLKEWIDQVFTEEFAYGNNAHGVRGKNLMIALTLGADAQFCAEVDPAEKSNLFALSNSLKPFESTAVYCSMNWKPSFTIFSVDQQTDEQLRDKARIYRKIIEDFC